MSFLNIFLTHLEEVLGSFHMFHPELKLLEEGPLCISSDNVSLLTRDGGILKRTYSLALVVLVLGMLLPHMANAEDYGLVWGVEEGDRFEFTLTNSFYDTTEVDDFFVEIDSLPSLDEVTQIPVAPASFYWMDGTSMGLEEQVSEFLVVPIGNWTFLTDKLEHQILNDYLEGHMIESFTVWGFDVALYLYAYLCELRLEISKADGVPNILRIDYYEGATKAGFVEMLRKGSLPPPIFIGLGVGVVSMVLIAVVLFKRR
jgi:hypothetical protein